MNDMCLTQHGQSPVIMNSCMCYHEPVPEQKMFPDQTDLANFKEVAHTAWQSYIPAKY